VRAEGERGIQNRRCESGGAAAKHQSVVGGLFQGHIHKAEKEKNGSGNTERRGKMAGKARKNGGKGDAKWRERGAAKWRACTFSFHEE
jgi:hypothetical protein